MDSPLLEQIRQFLDGLERIQAELLNLFAVKSRELVRGSASELERLNERERDCASRLQSLLSLRHRILTKAGGDHSKNGSLERLAMSYQGVPGWDEALERILTSKRIQQQLRQESWTHWIISHRCYNHYTEILDLIAHQGHKEVTYSTVPHQSVQGGAMLDACI